MNNYCVYKHTSPSGKVYVGITKLKPKYRWNNGKGYTRTDEQILFKRAIIKYGWDNFTHTIILDNVSELEAKYTERYLIRWYKIHNLSYNITDGGDGALGAGHTHTGWHHSTESKRKMSESRKGILSGINNPMFGRHETNPAFGKFGKNHPASKIVKQYTKEGIFIRYWDCISDVERELNIKVTHITACCNGRQKTAGGYIWKRETNK